MPPSNGIPVTMNQDALERARGLKPSVPQHSSGLAGEVASRDYMLREYRGRAKEIVVHRSGNVPVFDGLFDVGNGEYVVVESKGTVGPAQKNLKFGEIKRWETGPTGVRVRKTYPQFSPQWFEGRLDELKRPEHGVEGQRLAKSLEEAWKNGKVRAIVLQPHSLRHTGELVELHEDRTGIWNEHRGVQTNITTPEINRPPDPIDVERGLATPERMHAPPELPTARVHPTIRPSIRSTLVKGSRRALVAGVRVWRATRIIGTAVVLCFVPLTALDVVLEVAFWLWGNRQEEKRRKEEQKPLEAVFKDRRLKRDIQNKILESREVHENILAEWNRNKKQPGFWYVRIVASLRIEAFIDAMGNESDARYSVDTLDVFSTGWAHGYELGDARDVKITGITDAETERLYASGVFNAAFLRKVVKRKTLKYTIVPPVVTPFDIVVIKINNLFLDLVEFIAYFNGIENDLEIVSGFDYRYGYEAQFKGVLLGFPDPLDEAACRYCLAYLHWAAKQLSQHPLKEQDLEGHLEDPQRGWRRRFWLLQSLLDGRDTTYRKNFSFVAEHFKRLVKKGQRDEGVDAAIASLYAGAREIWYDLERIERNIGGKEYFYQGP